jgi:fatty acid desaturase
MNSVEIQTLIPQADYAKKLRPLLPPEAFLPDFSKLWILLINLAILLCGWAIAAHLDQWNGYWLWLYLPLTLLMGNSVIALLFSSHDLMHGSVIKNARLIQAIGLIGMTLLWMPPTFWKLVHNRVHHSKTNSLQDPDRNYLHEQPKNWGKWIQHRFTPSIDVTLPELTLGMTMAWGIHNVRNLSSVLLFNRKSVDYVPAAFTASAKERLAIARELLVIAALHLCILAYLQFDPLKLMLSYFLPIGIGYAGVMFYIYTNHMVCRMTEINDPLVNSLSLRVPKIFDLLHFNFSYHAEHHIFPGLNSDYYPVLQQLILAHYPERSGYLIEAKEAWRLLLQTPRHYRDENTFTNWSGKVSMSCPLSQTVEKH